MSPPSIVLHESQGKRKQERKIGQKGDIKEGGREKERIKIRDKTKHKPDL